MPISYVHEAIASFSYVGRTALAQFRAFFFNAFWLLALSDAQLCRQFLWFVSSWIGRRNPPNWTLFKRNSRVGEIWSNSPSEGRSVLILPGSCQDLLGQSFLLGFLDKMSRNKQHICMLDIQNTCTVYVCIKIQHLLFLKIQSYHHILSQIFRILLLERAFEFMNIYWIYTKRLYWLYRYIYQWAVKHFVLFGLKTGRVYCTFHVRKKTKTSAQQVELLALFFQWSRFCSAMVWRPNEWSVDAVPNVSVCVLYGSRISGS